MILRKRLQPRRIARDEPPVHRNQKFFGETQKLGKEILKQFVG